GADDVGVALGIGADLASPLVAVALVVRGLALALAADAVEDRLPHAIRVIQPPQPDIDELHAVLVADLLPQIIGPLAAQELVAELIHPRLDLGGGADMDQFLQRHLADDGADAAGDARAEDLAGPLRRADGADELVNALFIGDAPADVAIDDQH